MPTYAATVSRRRLLVGAATLVALTVTVAGCGSAPPPPDLDDLTTALDRARSDSRLATETAERTRGPVAQALEAVAAERSAHAEALADEIVRLTGQAAPTTSVTAGTTTATSSTSSVADPPPTVDDVIGALRTSAESATTSAAVLSGYRAGLLGSIAAACTAAYTVALVPLGETP